MGKQIESFETWLNQLITHSQIELTDEIELIIAESFVSLGNFSNGGTSAISKQLIEKRVESGEEFNKAFYVSEIEEPIIGRVTNLLLEHSRKARINSRNEKQALADAEKKIEDFIQKLIQDLDLSKENADKLGARLREVFANSGDNHNYLYKDIENYILASLSSDYESTKTTNA